MSLDNAKHLTEALQYRRDISRMLDHEFFQDAPDQQALRTLRSVLRGLDRYTDRVTARYQRER